LLLSKNEENFRKLGFLKSSFAENTLKNFEREEEREKSLYLNLSLSPLTYFILTVD